MKSDEFQRHTIDVNELSEALGVRRHAILQHRSGVREHPLLVGLPTPAANRPRLTWWRSDILDWVESRRTFRPPAAPAAHDPEPQPPLLRGRPCKYSSAAPTEGGAA
jgi:hypothetical protein